MAKKKSQKKKKRKKQKKYNNKIFLTRSEILTKKIQIKLRTVFI